MREAFGDPQQALGVDDVGLGLELTEGDMVLEGLDPSVVRFHALIY